LPEMSLWKAVCVCFDITMLFYTFSAMWVARQDDTIAVTVFFLSRRVGPFSAAYAYLVFMPVAILVTFLIFAGGFAGIFIVDFVPDTLAQDQEDQISREVASFMVASKLPEWMVRHLPMLKWILRVVGCCLGVCLGLVVACVLALAAVSISVFIRLTIIMGAISLSEIKLSNSAIHQNASYFVDTGKDFSARMMAVLHVASGKRQVETPTPFHDLWRFGLDKIKEAKEEFTKKAPEIQDGIKKYDEERGTPDSKGEPFVFKNRRANLVLLFIGLVVAFISLVLWVLQWFFSVFIFPLGTFALAIWKLATDGTPICPMLIFLFSISTCLFAAFVFTTFHAWSFIKYQILMHLYLMKGNDFKCDDVDAKMDAVNRTYKMFYRDKSINHDEAVDGTVDAVPNSQAGAFENEQDGKEMRPLLTKAKAPHITPRRRLRSCCAIQ